MIQATWRFGKDRDLSRIYDAIPIVPISLVKVNDIKSADDDNENPQEDC